MEQDINRIYSGIQGIQNDKVNHGYTGSDIQGYTGYINSMRKVNIGKQVMQGYTEYTE